MIGKNLPLTKHNLEQSILLINDLIQAKNPYGQLGERDNWGPGWSIDFASERIGIGLVIIRVNVPNNLYQ